MSVALIEFCKTAILMINDWINDQSLTEVYSICGLNMSFIVGRNIQF